MNRRSKRRGIALVWTALVLIVMVLMVGLSIDMGIGVLAAHHLQNASDAGALAGAQWVKLDKTNAVLQAHDLAKANSAMGNDVDLEYLDPDTMGVRNDMDIVLGIYYSFRHQRNIEPWFVPDTIQPNAVMTIARRTTAVSDGPISTVFGPMVGVQSFDITRSAIAFSQDNSGAGVIALNPDGTGFTMSGNMTIHCEGGDIQVNSEDERAVVFNGNPTPDSLDARQLNICSDAIDRDLITGCPIPYELDVEPIPDPLQDVPRPGTADGAPGPEVYNSPIYAETQDRDPIAANSWSRTDPETGKKLLSPGYYPAGFNISGGDWVLEPGVYLLGGGQNGNTGLVITGGTIVAQYCQFYITKSTAAMGSVYGQINITGSAGLTFSPPGDNPDNYVDGEPVIDGALGVTIWQDDLNTRDAFIAGSTNGGDDVITGTLYFPKNEVAVAGENFYAGSQLIANQIDAGGTGEVWINYDGRNRGQALLKSGLVK